MAMPTTAEILDAIEARLTALYSTRPVYRRKHDVRDRTPLASILPSDFAEDGFFVLCAAEPDPCEQIMSFEHVHFITTVELDYVTIAAPDERDEKQDTRDVRIALNDAFNVPKPSGFPAGSLVMSFEHGKPYGEAAYDKRLSVSTQTMKVHTTRARGVGT